MAPSYRSVFPLLVLCACVRSELDPEANVQLSGRVEQPGGKSDGAVQVSLSRAKGNLCSNGLERFATATTDADGNYAFSLRGADTQAGDLARCFRVAPAPAADGSTAWAQQLLQVTRPVAPVLPRWPWNLAGATAAQGGVAFSFNDLRAVMADGASRLRVLDAAGLPAWEVISPEPGVVLDAALLEDFPGVRAQVQLDRTVSGQKTSVDLSFRSAEVPVGPGTRMPASRGAACNFGGAPSCPLTDGMLSRASATADNLEITLELPFAIQPWDVVVRGLDSATGATRFDVFGTTVEGVVVPLGGMSSDEALGAFERTPLESGGIPVVAVTLRWLDRSGNGVPVTGLSEISIFDAP